MPFEVLTFPSRPFGIRKTTLSFGEINVANSSRSFLIVGHFIIIEVKEDNYTLSEDSLLYIAQSQSDENGDVTFTYNNCFGEKEWIALICGECNHKPEDWETVNESTEEEEGLQVRTCQTCGEIVEYQPIEKLHPSTTTEPTVTETETTFTEPVTDKPTEPTVTESTPTETETTSTESTTDKPTEPIVTEPTSTEPNVTEPTPTETETTASELVTDKPTEPTVTESTSTETETTSTEPTTDKPTEPTVTESTPTETTATEPVTDKPTEPTVTEPTSTETETIATEPTVTEPVVKKTIIKLSKTKTALYVKQSFTLKATVKNSIGKTNFKSSNSKVAKVNSKGVVTALKKGTAKITVTNNGVKKTCTVTVKNPKLNKTKLTLKKGKTFTLKITGRVGKAKFTSNKKSVATVNSKGKITAQKKGKAKITVKTNGLTFIVAVTVK